MKNIDSPKAQAKVAEIHAPGVRATPLGAALLASALAFPVGLILALLDLAL